MMKTTKPWLAVLASSLLLASCVQPTAPNSSGEISSVPTPSSSVVEEDPYDHTELEPLSDISRGISVSTSGYLGDLSVGMSLANNSSYPIVFTISDNPSGTVRVYSDNENVLTATSDTSGSNWTLHTHKAGEAHLIIEDGDGIIHYRHVVPVKPKLDAEAAQKAVYEVDHWVTNAAFATFTGTMRLDFTKNGVGTIDGTEGGGVTFNKLQFTYVYAPTLTNVAEDTDHWFVFQVTNWTEQALVVTYFAIWEAGDTLHLHTTQSILGIFNPAEAE